MRRLGLFRWQAVPPAPALADDDDNYHGDSTVTSVEDAKVHCESMVTTKQHSPHDIHRNKACCRLVPRILDL